MFYGIDDAMPKNMIVHQIEISLAFKKGGSATEVMTGTARHNLRNELLCIVSRCS